MIVLKMFRVGLCVSTMTLLSNVNNVSGQVSPSQHANSLLVSMTWYALVMRWSTHSPFLPENIAGSVGSGQTSYKAFLLSYK